MDEHRPGNRLQNPAYNPPSLSGLSRLAHNPYARVLRKPPRLRPGTRVAVVSASGPVDPAKLDRGLAYLREWGLDPFPGKTATKRLGYLAGTDAERAACLQEVLDDDGCEAIFFSRGGYGLSRIILDLDLSGLIAKPKLLMGFSDVTVLQLAAARYDLASVYGPVVAGTFALETPDPLTVWSVKRLVGPDEATGLLRFDGSHGLRFLGSADPVTAPLVGGCLTLLAASVGTPVEPATRGGILFWEDVSEDLYRLDRLLTQLKLAGKLDGLAGMIIGVPHLVTRGRESVTDLTDFIAWWLGEPDYPVVTQFPCGHGVSTAAMPLGRPVTIRPGQGVVEVDPL